jgi:copper chaperone CopZ
MKALKSLFIALSLTLCAGAAKAELKPNEAEVTFKSNFTCENCKAKIEKNIPFEKGFVDMEVKLSDNTIYVKYNAKKTTVEKLQKAIQKLGYTAEVASENRGGEKK